MAMISWLSQKLADLLASSDEKAKENRDIYVYGLDVLLSTAANILCVLAIGAVAGRFAATLIFLAGFVALRSVAGGYHASTHFRCFLIMLAAYAAAMAPTFLLGWEALRLAALPAAAVSLAVVIALAPAPHENRPVTPGQLRRFRALSLWLAGGGAAAAAACFALSLDAPAYALAAGMVTAAGSLCAAHAVSRRNRNRPAGPHPDDHTRPVST
jgi:accessory gene regulator B